MILNRLDLAIKFSKNGKLNPFGVPCCFDVNMAKCLKTCTFGKLGICYADNNFRENLDPRIKILDDNYQALDNSDTFVQDFISLIKINGNPRNFRFFAAGDIDKVSHIKKINKIAMRTPLTSYWMPTHRIDLIKRWLNDGNFKAKNLNIRVSCPEPNYHITKPKRFSNLMAWAVNNGLTVSEVITSDDYIIGCSKCTKKQCKTIYGHNIEECDKCYNSEVDLIQYTLKNISKAKLNEMHQRFNR